MYHWDVDRTDNPTRIADDWVLDSEMGGARVLFAFGPPGPTDTPENRMQRLLEDLGAEIGAIRWGEQVHGRVVASLAAESGHPLENAACVGRSDALITANHGVGLVVWTADCVPILFAGDGVVCRSSLGMAGLRRRRGGSSGTALCHRVRRPAAQALCDARARHLRTTVRGEPRGHRWPPNLCSRRGTVAGRRSRRSPWVSLRSSRRARSRPGNGPHRRPLHRLNPGVGLLSSRRRQSGSAVVDDLSHQLKLLAFSYWLLARLLAFRF